MPQFSAPHSGSGEAVARRSEAGLPLGGGSEVGGAPSSQTVRSGGGPRETDFRDEGEEGEESASSDALQEHLTHSLRGSLTLLLSLTKTPVSPSRQCFWSLSPQSRWQVRTFWLILGWILWSQLRLIV